MPDFFELLLLLQFLLIIMICFTRDTGHVMPPCNTTRISKVHHEFQISLKCYSFFSSYWIILIFLPATSCKYIVPTCNKAGISKFHLEFQMSVKSYYSFSAYWVILNFCHGNIYCTVSLTDPLLQTTNKWRWSTRRNRNRNNKFGYPTGSHSRGHLHRSRLKCGNWAYQVRTKVCN